MSEQRHVIHFLWLKGTNNKDIYTELRTVYGEISFSLSAVKYWTKAFKLGREDVNDAERTGRPYDIMLRTSIENALKKDPYISARQIAQFMNCAPSTVTSILIEDLGYKSRHLRWVPHNLTNAMKSRRIADAKEMLSLLSQARAQGFKGFLTGDESWFVYTKEPTNQWILKDDRPDDVVIKSNFQKKTMVTIFFSPEGRYLIDLLPKGQKFNSEYFISVVLPKLTKLAYPEERSPFDRKWFLHFDNAPSHKSKKVQEMLNESDFHVMHHPPYSPDIAPCDFGLFGTVKRMMPYRELMSEDELAFQIDEVIQSLGSHFFEKLFIEWEKRLISCINAKGEYIH